MNEEIFPHSLARIRVEELKKELILLVRKEFNDFHIAIQNGAKWTSTEHLEFVRLLIELENMIETA